MQEIGRLGGQSESAGRRDRLGGADADGGPGGPGGQGAGGRNCSVAAGVNGGPDGQGAGGRIRLVATDIDGTLVKDSSPEVYPEIVQMLRRLTEQGILCCVASGRQYHSIHRMFADAGEHLIYIAENGAHIVYQGKTLSVTDMQREQAHEIIRQMRACGEGYEFVVSTPQGSLLESRDEQFIALIRDSYHNKMEVVPDVLKNDPQIIKCAMHRNGSVRRVAEQEMIPRWKEHVKVCMAGEEWIDFMDAAVDKGNAIRFVQTYFDVSYEETMAFGDNENDIGMMKAAGMSYAVENACDAVKRAANHRCPDYTQKGVYQVLRDTFCES
ncbi:MAG: Cof-type HAD-IIB family hydrolase [bacterium]|nr:Cof-type HAD-IIB family hydrolase [bacterium]